jgi:hypothetical protein
MNNYFRFYRSGNVPRAHHRTTRPDVIYLKNRGSIFFFENPNQTTIEGMPSKKTNDFSLNKGSSIS